MQDLASLMRKGRTFQIPGAIPELTACPIKDDPDLRTNNVNANLTALRTFYYDVLLLTTAYSACAVRFFLGQFPNMELLLLLLSLYSLLNSLYFPG